jgi:hypothetical protein
VGDGTTDRLAAALAAIDEANAEDPNVLVVGDVRGPKELVHARMMTGWLDRLDPGADELQHLAARAHHFRRWTSPRSDHPAGRAGYLRWRNAARRRHADEVGELLVRHGYTEDEVVRVASIIRKQGLGIDPAVQVHEDALCLVFLQTQLTGVADRLGDDATVEVLVRTIPKMSPAGLDAAAGLSLDPGAGELLARAVRVTSDEAEDD